MGPDAVFFGLKVLMLSVGCGFFCSLGIFGGYFGKKTIQWWYFCFDSFGFYGYRLHQAPPSPLRQVESVSCLSSADQASQRCVRRIGKGRRVREADATGEFAG